MTVTTTENDKVAADGTVTTAADPVDTAVVPLATVNDRLVESDLLVEDVSIDGMCGVY
jgi:mycofactocin precursor